jgi:hypothetical protein
VYAKILLGLCDNVQVTKRPLARKSGIIIEDLEEELLIYDGERDRGHCLNPVAAAIWRACNGRRTPAQLAARAASELSTAIPESVVRLGLEQLSRAHLLHEAWSPSRASRREILKGMLLLPAVASILAPRAVQAASCRGPGQFCTKRSECCPGLICVGGQLKRCRVI